MAVFVILVGLVAMMINVKSSEIYERVSSPKVEVVNPFWKTVKKYAKELDNILYLRDVLRYNGKYHPKGYILYVDYKDFMDAYIETIKITGRRPIINTWRKWTFFQVEKYGMVIIYEKRD